RMARDPGTALSATVAREVAQRAGIPLVITGRVSAAGSGFLVTTTLESAGSGAVLATVQRGARGADDLLGAIDWLARRLRERAGDSYRTVGAAPPLAEVTTASLPALRAFSHAVGLAERQGRFADAVPLLVDAIRLDSTFASAWRFAATYGWVSGRPGTEVVRFTREAYRRRNRGTPGERVDIEGFYASFTNSRALADAPPSMERPQAVAIHLLRVLRELGRNEEAASLALAKLRADSAAGQPSSYSTYLNLATAQAGMGRLAEARRTLAELRRVAPDAFLTQFTGRLVAWRAGGADSLEAYLRDLAGSTNPQTAVARVEMQAVAIGLRGRLRAYAVAARQAEANPPTAIRSIYTLQHAVGMVAATAVHRAQPAQGVRQLDSLRRADPQRELAPMDRRDPELAIAYAQLGRPDLARPLLANYLGALDADQRLYAWARWRLAEGEVALAEGRVADAITAFRKAGGSDSGKVEPAWSGRVDAAMGRAFDRGGRSDSAAAYFARLADGDLPIDGPLTLPIALRRLGELAEARGDLPEAIRRYRAFAQLWRDADPELQPQVADVRRRIAALEAREARGR
ncbi:MAG: hypothetical protein KJT01_13750, partial [Gemmatimonadetes bacterium]|nr:hypothetical protein [Gemmatimonadota bacterium]